MEEKSSEEIYCKLFGGTQFNLVRMVNGMTSCRFVERAKANCLCFLVAASIYLRARSAAGRRKANGTKEIQFKMM